MGTPNPLYPPERSEGSGGTGQSLPPKKDEAKGLGGLDHICPDGQDALFGGMYTDS